MTIVIIGGTPNAPLDAYEQHLQGFGLAKALESKASEIKNVHEWIDRYFASGVPAEIPAANSGQSVWSKWFGGTTANSGKGLPQAVSTPWLLAISNLILANSAQPVWGWANRRNSHLVDLWMDLDPRTLFVGLVTPPDHALALAQQASESLIDVVNVLAVWKKTVQHMLDMKRKHPGRVHLIDTRQATEARGIELAKWLRLPGAVDLNPAQSTGLLPSPDGVLCSVFAHVVAEDELVSAVWRKLQTELGLNEVVKATQLTEIAHTLLKLKSELKSTLNELSASNQTHAEEVKKKTAALSEKESAVKLVASLQDKLVQLEKEAKHASKTLAEQTQAKVTALAERDSHAQLASDRQNQLARLTKETEILKVEKATEVKAKQASIAEREKLAKALSDSHALHAKLQQELASLKQAKTEENKTALHLEQKWAELKAQYDKLHKQLTVELQLKADALEENQLLLQQLHQVQEELEKFFIDGLELKAENDKLSQRVQRLMARFPGTVEWDSLHAKADKTSLRLDLINVITEQRTLDRLQLVVGRSKKQPTLQVVDLDERMPVLLHGALQKSLNLASPSDATESAELAYLATSDVKLLQSVCKSVSTAMPDDVLGRDRWASDLKTLAEQFNLLAPAWRYDRVQLKNEQINPDYEHLWFKFENVSYGTRTWPSFEFRLSAANVRKGQFSKHPKLEFPMPGQGIQKQFENWFEESEDDHGLKYELRFDLSRREMDINAWLALSDIDQRQLQSIINILPRVVIGLKNNGISIKRDPNQWCDLIYGINELISTLVPSV